MTWRSFQCCLFVALCLSQESVSAGLKHADAKCEEVWDDGASLVQVHATPLPRPSGHEDITESDEESTLQTQAVRLAAIHHVNATRIHTTPNTAGAASLGAVSDTNRTSWMTTMGNDAEALAQVWC